MNAATSLPRKFSPSPSPTTSGELRRAPTTVSVSSACTATSVNAPSSRRHTRRIASARSCPDGSYSSDSRCATTSVSVSERSSCPRASSSSRSDAKFSMIPLWMMATRESSSRCGCALRSFGAPCVAQRVWPMPTVLGDIGCSASTFSRFPSLPARLRVSRCPSETTATPAESYPRYSRRRSPSTTTSSACLSPTYPTMPHMRARVRARDCAARLGDLPLRPDISLFAWAEGAPYDSGEPVGGRLRLVLRRRLDHHADDRLGAAGAQQDPSPPRQRGRLGGHGGGELAVVGRAVLV